MLTLSIPNQSGLDRLQYSWTGPPPGSVDAGVGGAAGRDGAVEGGAGGAAGSSGAGGGSGGASANSGGAGGANLGRGGVDAAAGGAGGARTEPSGAGGVVATGGAAAGSGGITVAAGGAGATSPTTSSGGSPGTAAIGSGGAGSGGSTSSGTTRPPNAGGEKISGCSCMVGQTSQSAGNLLVFLPGLIAIAFRTVQRRRCRHVPFKHGKQSKRVGKCKPASARIRRARRERRRDWNRGKACNRRRDGQRRCHQRRDDVSRA